MFPSLPGDLGMTSFAERKWWLHLDDSLTQRGVAQVWSGTLGHGRPPCLCPQLGSINKRVLEGSRVGSAGTDGNASLQFPTATHKLQLKESSLKLLGKNRYLTPFLFPFWKGGVNLVWARIVFRGVSSVSVVLEVIQSVFARASRDFSQIFLFLWGPIRLFQMFVEPQSYRTGKDVQTCVVHPVKL